MTIKNMISIVSKHEDEGSASGQKENGNKVHEDIFNELQGSVEQLTSKYKHTPTQKNIVEIYPDLPTFHQAVGEEDAPNWFMGTFTGNIIKIVSPLDPGRTQSELHEQWRQYLQQQIRGSGVQSS